jgi:hypothetical protein
MADIAKWYEEIATNVAAINVAKPSRTWDPDAQSVYMITTPQAKASFGGKPDVAVMMTIRKAAESLADLFGAWRLSTAADAEVGGPIYECHRLQREQLAARNIEVANSGDGNNKNPRRTEVPTPRHLREQV